MRRCFATLSMTWGYITSSPYHDITDLGQIHAMFERLDQGGSHHGMPAIEE